MIRATNNSIARQLIFNAQASLGRLLTTQLQVATGKRIFRPSDDTVGSAMAFRFEGALAGIDRYKGVIATGLSRLQSTDTALSDAYQKGLDAYNIALEQLDSSATPESRTAAAQNVSDIITGLLATSANFKFEDRYLFGGSRTGTAPFVEYAGGILYQGDEVSLYGNVAQGQSVAMNLTGAEAFGALSSAVEGSVDLNPGVTLGSGAIPPTRLTDLNQGGGVAEGAIAITIGATTTTVDLSGAEDLDDVRDLIQAAVPSITVSVTAGGTGLRLTHGSSNFTVAESGGGTTAADLGIDGTSAGFVLNGSDLDPRLTSTTPISSLNGTGLTLTTVDVTNGTLSATIDLSGATTIEDLLQAFNSAQDNGQSLALEATINDDGTGIDVRSRLSGAFLNIEETTPGTTTSAADLGILFGMTAATPLHTINGGTGFLGGPVSMTYSGGTVEVDLTEAETVEDLQEAFSDATNGVVTLSTVVVSGTRRFRLTDSGGGANPTLNTASGGSAETITDLGFTDGGAGSGGVLTGGDVDPQGVRAENLFTALDSLRDALEANDTVAINRAATLLDTVLSDLSQTRGSLGGRITKLQSIDARHSADQLDLQALLSEKVDVDLTEAVSELALRQNAYQVALQVAASINQLSLANFLR